MFGYMIILEIYEFYGVISQVNMAHHRLKLPPPPGIAIRIL